MNFQNIPRTNTLIKRAFLPKLDSFACFDYEQVEYRILAFYLAEACGDDSMAETFRQGHDPHATTAGLVLGRDIKNDDERQIGKTLNFSIVYAGGVPTVLRQMARAGIACDRETAREWIRELHSQMPSVRVLYDLVAEETRSKGYVFDVFGRHYRPDPTISYRDALRKMVNALIQGCAAGLARQALVKIDKGTDMCGLESHMVNFVHDEIIMDSAEHELDDLAELMPVWMDNEIISKIVPITVEMNVGRTWADKEKYVRN